MKEKIRNYKLRDNEVSYIRCLLQDEVNREKNKLSKIPDEFVKCHKDIIKGIDELDDLFENQGELIQE
jgi:hypothetical protein